ncbi:glyoxalase [Enemella evansiae]|uniref:VOC family protein n=1 Tax=Enemella evansiae TaxID=2016499 RepID=UPI000B96F0FD|nr:VOC family protein [Enemella evansiae]OYN99523.1 glyoxalase [Enemella evansiae]
MSSAPFVFFDLRTPDIDRARSFYGELAGVSIRDVPAGASSIPMFATRDEIWGGFTELSEGDPRPPQWVPYLPVEDVDLARNRAVELGATIVRDRTDLPAGSVVVIADPGGATVALWQGK